MKRIVVWLKSGQEIKYTGEVTAEAVNTILRNASDSLANEDSVLTFVLGDRVLTVASRNVDYVLVQMAPEPEDDA